MSRLLCASCAVAALVVGCPSAFAQSNDLPAIVVTGEGAGGGSLTAPGVAELRREINQTAGSVGFVDSESFKDRYTKNLYDVLKDSPGVNVQERYGQELRVSIRGSAIARAFHGRGVDILQDGISFNNADGSGDYYQIDPLALRAIEIYKGGNGLAYGSSYLGGAINFITPTARTAIAPFMLRFNGGSWGTLQSNIQASRVWGDYDALVNATYSHQNGYRDHSLSDYQHYNGNFGYRINANVETRFYTGIYNTDQKLPGSLNLTDALNNPTMAAPTAKLGDQARNVRLQRIANRTTVRVESGKVDLDTWAMHKTLVHPIFQVIDQDGWTYGFAPKYTGSLNLAGFRNDVIAGARVFAGDNKARQFINVSGTSGAQTLNARQEAVNYEAYFENRFFFLPQIALMTGAKVLRNERKNTDYGGFGRTPSVNNQVYEGVNPKVGLIWEPRPDVQVFADVTRSMDVPDFTDLTQNLNGTTGTQFVSLAAQKAWTAEVGSRGRWDRFTWDVTLYRSEIRDELLQFTVAQGVPATTFNAPKTRHQGVELGGSVEIWRDILGPAKGDTLTLSQLWNYSDFRFVDDPIYGSNKIAGTPEHILRTIATYRHPNGFYFAPSVDFIPTGAWVDYANTLRAPSHTLIGLQTGVQTANGALLYLDARNLTDRRYISDFGTVTDARTASTAVFYPGTGRSIYMGMRFALN
jgi:iron complex outermembrane receptor protein